MQGNHATELMSRARSRRNLYQPEPGTGPSVCSVGHYVVSVRISVWHRRVPVPFVSRRGQSNDTSNLFFQQSFIPQLGNRQTGGRAINSVFGQDHKLIAILFVAENEGDQKAVPDVLCRHNAILGA